MASSAQKISVLHVSSDANLGGAGRYLETLLSEPLYRSSLCIEAACPAPGVLRDRLVALGVRVHELKGSDRSFEPKQLPGLYTLIKRGRYDIVHTHGSLTARIASRLVPRTKVVFTKHTMGRTGGRLASAVQNVLADRVICPSRAVQNELLRSGIDPRKLDLVHNAVDAEALAAEASRAGALAISDASAPVIMCSGRLEAEKGIRFMIEAMPLVLEQAPGCVLWVVGDGSLRPELEHVARALGVSQSVVFWGFRSDVAALLSHARVFVLPSLAEAFGLSLLEAMALGVPAVASRVGGVPEIVAHGETGLLVTPGAPADLASAVCLLLSRPEYAAELAMRARLSVKERFSASRQADLTLQSYRKALGQTGV